MMPLYRFSVFCLLLLITTFVNASKVGENTPNCTLNNLSGDSRYDLQAWRGKVIYVDFWASWCAPCAKSFPFLNSLHKQYSAKGLQILAVNMDEQTSDTQAFLSQHPAEFSVATDLLAQCAENFAVEAMPSSYIIDRKGIVRHVHVGFRPDEAEQVHTLLKQLLAEK